MQPKTYIYSKLAFFHLIISGFHFTEKGKSYHPAIKQETNATICQVLFSSEQTGHPRKPKRTVPENPYKPSGTDPTGYFLSEIKT